MCFCQSCWCHILFQLLVTVRIQVTSKGILLVKLSIVCVNVNSFTKEVIPRLLLANINGDQEFIQQNSLKHTSAFSHSSCF